MYTQATGWKTIDLHDKRFVLEFYFLIEYKYSRRLFEIHYFTFLWGLKHKLV